MIKVESEPIFYGQDEIVGEGDAPVGVVQFDLPLKASEFDSEKGSIKKHPNTLNKIRDFFQHNPKAASWLEKLGVDVESGEVNARFYATVGGLIFIIGAAVELGIREGEDVRKLANYMRETKERKA